MTISEALDIGVTRTLTKREEHKRQAGALLTLLCAAAALWAGLLLGALVRGVDRPRLVFRSVMTGQGDGAPLLDFSGKAANTDTGSRWQFPVQFVSPEINWWITGPITVVVFVLLFRFTAARLFRSRANVRHRSLADTAAIEAGFGRKQARAAGKFTLPGTTWWQRRRLPMRAFAVYVGRATSAKAGDLWVSSNRRVRIVARSGWGKSHRLMIPIIRNLVGPALVSSIETDIFTATVKAREWRWPDGRPRWFPERVPANPFMPDDKATWQRPEKQRYPVYRDRLLPGGGEADHEIPVTALESDPRVRELRHRAAPGGGPGLRGRPRIGRVEQRDRELVQRVRLRGPRRLVARRRVRPVHRDRGLREMVAGEGRRLPVLHPDHLRLAGRPVGDHQPAKAPRPRRGTHHLQRGTVHRPGAGRDDLPRRAEDPRPAGRPGPVRHGGPRRRTRAPCTCSPNRSR